ncbi:zinc finger CCCH domain-containing protein 6 [Cynara cardunculus var. scolymus]|uniref:zinc finger CCCH domain-containing protein 6 n=1 Tax=Cynara cardunculus var. scolymus TaxID=59895 RepID=UPI000D62BB9B|nr:zinc finger CCCH domain-containing protein 6 [Cynara cardunculus var. scolymus]
MRGLQKSKRVSWASDLNLCQVKLFLSDESPSQVGLGGQDHLQAKASWPWHSAGAGSDDNLPPGFEGIQPANLLQNKLSQVPLIQWKCPSRFVLDPNWQVAAGEESKELEVESQREMRVLEAVYPRPSAIPPNPASAMGADEPYYNDQHTPLIPITPIEDEDMAPDSSSIAANTSLQAPATMATQSGNGGMVSGVEPDVVSAAYSALNAAMSNGSQGSLIDPNLLIKILSNPTLIEKLVSSTQGPSASGPQISQALSMPTLPAISVAEPPPPPPPVHGRTTHLPFSTASSSSSNAHYPPASRVGPVPVPVPASNLAPPEVNPAKKDINYYKSLIQQHGGEKAESVNSNNVKTRGDTKGKIMKPCIYYNSTRGCRHGANCVFQHDSSSSQQQQRVSLPDSKRMKMDSREISGT